MKTKTIFNCLIVLLWLSCTHHDYQYYFSQKGILNDIDSISGDPKNAKAFYIDSTIMRKQGILIDSNFILANLKNIDNSILHTKYLNEQGFSYTFSIIDTIKSTKFGDFLLIKGRYLYKFDPRIIMDQYKLFLMRIKNDSVSSVYELAFSMENSWRYLIKYSAILPDFKIISRTIFHGCSDIETNKGLNCITNLTTDFIYFSNSEDRFLKYKHSHCNPIE